MEMVPSFFAAEDPVIGIHPCSVKAQDPVVHIRIHLDSICIITLITPRSQMSVYGTPWGHISVFVARRDTEMCVARQRDTEVCM